MFILTLAKGAFWLLGGVRGVHKERMPRSGPVIVAPIHVSHFDPPAVACGCPRPLRFMAKEELFRGLFGKLIASVGAFPVKRGENDTESIRLALSLLEKGEAVLIFPEGTRGDGVHLQPLNKGVALLAKRAGALVIPVAIVGTHIALPRGQSKPRRAKIRIYWGMPATYSELAAGPDGKESRDQFAAELSRRLVALCHEAGLPLEIRNPNPAEPIEA